MSSVGDRCFECHHIVVLYLFDPFKYTSSRSSFAFRNSPFAFYLPSSFFQRFASFPESSFHVRRLSWQYFFLFSTYGRRIIYSIIVMVTGLHINIQLHICNKQCVHCAWCIYSQLMQMGVVFILSPSLLFSHFRFFTKQIWYTLYTVQATQHCNWIILYTYVYAVVDCISVFEIAIIIKIKMRGKREHRRDFILL